MSIRPPETSLRSQGSWSPFSLRDQLAHRAHVARRASPGSRGFGENGGDRRRRSRSPRLGSPATTRARVSAMCSQVSASVGLIEREGRELRRQRPLAPGGAQPQVDFVELARLGRRGQRGEQALRQPRVIERRAGSGRAPSEFAGVVGKIVDDDQIEIGGRGHFARAELAHREHRDAAAAHPAVIEREGVADPRRAARRRRPCASAL